MASAGTGTVRCWQMAYNLTSENLVAQQTIHESLNNTRPRWSDILPLDANLPGRWSGNALGKQSGVYRLHYLPNNNEVCYVGLGVIGCRVRRMRAMFKQGGRYTHPSGLTTEHTGGAKAYEYDSDINNWGISWVLISKENPMMMSNYENALIAELQPRFNCEHMGGVL